jgi:hypothetical protein
LSWRAIEPSPFRAWIRWAPRAWPAPSRPWLDLTGPRLGWPEDLPGRALRLVTTAPPPEAPELVYLPPVEGAAEAERDELLATLVDDGHVAVVQLFAGQAERPGLAGFHLLDSTPLLLGEGLGLPPPPFAPERAEATDLVVLLPLLPGFELDALDPVLDQAAKLAPVAVLPVTPELGPADRRRLVDRLGEERFDAVFHGEPPAETAVASRAARLGLRTLPARPLVTALPPRAARNREIAAALAEAGELWLRLGRSEGEGVALLAAARRVEPMARDVSALALEGHLGLLDFLSATARRVVTEAAEGEEGLLADLRARWESGAEPAETAEGGA